jgi:hypothetical protein
VTFRTGDMGNTSPMQLHGGSVDGAERELGNGRTPAFCGPPSGRREDDGDVPRMHLTLKQETTRPPGSNSLQQQDRFDAFLNEFNTERPREALAIKCPAELYVPSSRAYEGLPEVDYPFHDRDILVTACGRICMHKKKINIPTVLAGQKLGIKESTRAFGSSPS